MVANLAAEPWGRRLAARDGPAVASQQRIQEQDRDARPRPADVRSVHSVRHDPWPATNDTRRRYDSRTKDSEPNAGSIPEQRRTLGGGREP